jgi:iron complex transport system ATP-binding protein
LENPHRERASAPPRAAARTAKAAASPYIFETEDLHFAYTDRPVLCGVSLGIRRGAVTTLLGANACGKTTLLRLLCKDLSPSAGRVLLDGADIRGVRRREFAKRAAVVHQKTSAPDDLTVKQLTAYGRLAHRSMFRAGSAEDDEKIDRAMERAGVADLAETPIGTLSGGQRQRAFIAMALAQDTEILILDEPTTFLDVRYRIEILELIRNLNEEHGVTVVMVLHDINEALLCSDEVIGLADGRVLMQGPPDEVIDPDSIRRLYDVRLDVREDAESGHKWVLPTCCGKRREPAKARKAGGATAERADADADGENPLGTHAERARAGAHAFDGENTERARAVEFTADGAGKGGLMKRIVKPLFIALGFASLALGALGVVLPVLPTTPFLLLTAFCFARGSARFHRWFMGTRLYRNHIDDFVRTKSMTVKTKTTILTTVTVLLSLAIYFAPWPHARIAMGVVLAWHWWYFLLRVKTLRGEASGAPGAGEALGGKADDGETDGGGLGPQAGARDAGGGRTGAPEKDAATRRASGGSPGPQADDGETDGGGLGPQAGARDAGGGRTGAPEKDAATRRAGSGSPGPQADGGGGQMPGVLGTNAATRDESAKTEGLR